MTNREWLYCLSDEELAKYINDNCLCCDCCVKNVDGGHYCVSTERGYCENGIKKWLNAKHEIPMPELKIGDIVNVKFASSFEIKGTIVSKNVVLLNHEGFGCQSFKGHIESLCTEIKRYNELKGEMEVIWRADNVD